MQAVEALLTDEPHAIRDLACQVYGVDKWDDLTRAQVEAVRRACKRLAQLDRAALSEHRQHRVWPNNPGGRRSSYLTARTPLRGEERDAAEKLALAWAQARRARLERRQQADRLPAPPREDGSA